MGEQNKVVRFKKRKTINIGVVIFVVLFIYIAFNVYFYLTKDQLTIYEVHKGTTAVDNKITALVLRQEELFQTAKSGYVLYYQKDGARVAKNEAIYAISDNEVYNTDNMDSAAIVLTSKNTALLSHEIRSFRNSYSDSDYSKVLDFKDTAASTVLDILNSALISENQTAASTAGAITSDKSGIITYYTDNYEAVTEENFTADMFHPKDYTKTNLRTTDKISQSTPVYKMITSETWKLILPLTKDQYSRLKDQEKVSITVLEDDCDITAKLSFASRDSDQYAILSMTKDMANYLGERFLDIRINFSSVEGLKIPNTAIVEKEFYEVPLSYFTQGGDSKENGLVKLVYGENGDTSTQFVVANIYYQDDDNNYGYVDTDLFEAGTQIQPVDGSDTYTLSKTIKLSGVYNVNLGYAVFKRIEVLDSGKEYSIVSDHTSNGLSAYDHIILDGKLAEEQEIIY